MNAEKRRTAAEKKKRREIGATERAGFYFQAPEREGRWRVVTGGRGMTRRRDDRDEKGQGVRGREGRMGETERERDSERAVEAGSAPLRSFFSLAQRLTGIFCRPDRGDVKIALMVDQREKPCSDRYLSLSRLRASRRHRHP